MARLFVENDRMQLQLYSDEAQSFMAKAIAKSEKYSKIMEGRQAPYGQNHVHSHYIGMVSEHAAFVLMNEIEDLIGAKFTIDPVFQNEERDRECDIVVNGTRIEVKGIKRDSWNRYGPCITVAQRKNIERKADVVLWVQYNEKTDVATFNGFNYVKDIKRIEPVFTGPPGRLIENHQVLDIIHPLQDLKL